MPDLLSLLELDLHETSYCCATYGALICLHSENLGALNAQAHVAARKNDGVLGDGEADNALFLGLVCDVRRSVIDAVDVIQLEDSVVILIRGEVRRG